jgi:hypothetical protein
MQLLDFSEVICQLSPYMLCLSYFQWSRLPRLLKTLSEASDKEDDVLFGVKKWKDLEEEPKNKILASFTRDEDKEQFDMLFSAHPSWLFHYYILYKSVTLTPK